MSAYDALLVIAVLGGISYLIILKMKKKGHDPLGYLREQFKKPIITSKEGLQQTWQEKRMGI